MGMMLAGSMVQQAGTDISTYARVGQAYSAYVAGRQRAYGLRMQARLQEFLAGDSDLAAADWAAQAGDAWERGLDEQQIRSLRLGQDVGRIYAASAGAGIDVASASVRRAEAADRAEAARDAEVIGRNAAAASASALSRAVSARQDAVWQRADARTLRLNAKYAKRSARMQMLGGLLSAAGFHAGQTAQNWSPG